MLHNFQPTGYRREKVGMRCALALTVLLGLLVTGCWGSGDAKDKPSKDAAFKEVFGGDPPQGVTGIVSSWFFLKDSYVRWIRFSCTEATLAQIRSMDGVKPIKAGEWPSRAPGNGSPNAPAWWKHARVARAMEEYDIDLSKHWANYGDGHIWIDRESGTVYAERSFSH
jgi:hypothetical protein